LVPLGAVDVGMSRVEVGQNKGGPVKGGGPPSKEGFALPPVFRRKKVLFRFSSLGDNEGKGDGCVSPKGGKRFWVKGDGGMRVCKNGTQAPESRLWEQHKTEGGKRDRRSLNTKKPKGGKKFPPVSEKTWKGCSGQRRKGIGPAHSLQKGPGQIHLESILAERASCQALSK